MKCPTCGGYFARKTGVGDLVIDEVHTSWETWWCPKEGDHRAKISIKSDKKRITLVSKE